MALGVGEHRNAGPSRHLCGAHHRTAPEILDLAQRCLEVSDHLQQMRSDPRTPEMIGKLVALCEEAKPGAFQLGATAP